jgi:hypothetical protein
MKSIDSLFAKPSPKVEEKDQPNDSNNLDKPAPKLRFGIASPRKPEESNGNDSGSTGPLPPHAESSQSAPAASPRLSAIFGSKSAGSAGQLESGTAPRAGTALSNLPVKSGNATDVPVESVGEPADQSVLDEANESAQLSQFPDETPASKPTRELPADLDKGQLQFIELIELLSGVIKGIMSELQANPQYMKLVSQLDKRTWVLGMRENMGLAKVKKAEKKASRGRGSSKALDTDLMAIADELSVNWGDLG